MARELETTTHGDVRMKWYLGGIAGDEATALDRVRRGQLDGVAGALFCGSLSPTLAVTRVAGLVQSRDEALHLLNHLRPRIDEDFKKTASSPSCIGNFGNDIMLPARPRRRFAELRKRPHVDLERRHGAARQMELMGLNMVPATIDAALGRSTTAARSTACSSSRRRRSPSNGRRAPSTSSTCAARCWPAA